MYTSGAVPEVLGSLGEEPFISGKQGEVLDILGVTALVGSVQYTCPVVLLCIVDAPLSHYVGK